MTEQHQVLFVPDQFATIQAAVDAVSGPVSIVVQPGLYRESIRVFGKQNVVIQSARLSRRGVTIAGVDGPAAIHTANSTLHLSGIAVRTESRLRGILAEDGHINLQECLVAGNRADPGADGQAGAGMLCRRSRVHIQKSAILANVAYGDVVLGAGLFLDECEAEIAGTTIQGNAAYASRQAQGGGMYVRGITMRMWRSRVTDNFLSASNCRGGGVYITEPSRCDFGGSVVTGNDCLEGAGGGIYIADGAMSVAVHRNTFVRQNSPTDVEAPAAG